MENKSGSHREIVRFEDKNALSQDAAYRFIALAAMSARAGKPFPVALSGGSTPAILYRLLSSSPFRETLSWNDIHLFFGDERCVPPDSPDSNYRMAFETLI